MHYVTHADAKNFQPANITFDLLPPLDHKIRDRQERRRQQCALALREFDGWLEKVGDRNPCGCGHLSAAFDLLAVKTRVLKPCTPTESTSQNQNQPQKRRTRVSAPHGWT